MLTEINTKVEQIKNNKEEINEFIENYKPFVISYCNKTLHRYIDYNNDDEYSIALIAFYEAIKSYNINKGSFIPYAQRVIKLRLIDNYRKNKSRYAIKTIDIDSDDINKDKFTSDKSIDIHNTFNMNYIRRLEIHEFCEELKEYKITLNDLVKCSPKWKSTRIKYNKILHSMIKSSVAISEFVENGRLPIKYLEQNTKLPRKTIERSRKYIISALIILLGDYQYLKGYISWEV